MRRAAIIALWACAGCSGDDDPAAADAAESGEMSPAVPCPAQGEVSNMVGGQLGDAEIRKCDAPLENLIADVACGNTLTLIDIGGAAFAPCVEATDAYVMDPNWRALRDRGLHVVQIMTTDGGGNIPSDSFCVEYSEEHAIDFSFFIDQTQRTRDIAPVHPVNIVVDAGATIVERWETDIPEDRYEALSDLLDERGL